MLTIGTCPNSAATRIEQPLSAASEHDWRQAQCVFLMSTGRVGTTSLVKILNLSPDIDARHEPAPLCLAEHKEAFQRQGESLECYRPLFTWARANPIRAARERGLVYAEHGFWPPFTELIAEMMPNAKFLFLTRHPGGVVRSGMRRCWYVRHSYDATRPVPAPGTPAAEAWAEWTPFQKVVWLWDMVNAHLIRCEKASDPHRWRRLHFEQWISPDYHGWEELFEWLGARPPSRELIAEAVKRPQNRQQYGEFPKYRDWSPEQKACLRRMAGETMAELGYE